MSSAKAPPYPLGVQSISDRLPANPNFPFSLPFLPGLDLRFRWPVTFFVGENGTGKSTLLEAIAALLEDGQRDPDFMGDPPESRRLLAPPAEGGRWGTGLKWAGLAAVLNLIMTCRPSPDRTP